MFPRYPAQCHPALQLQSLEDRTTPATFSYARGVGGLGIDYARDSVTDSLGNIYVAGRYSGVVNFNPAGTATSFTAANVTTGDLFIAKYSPAGILTWMRSITPASANTDIIDLAVDPADNVYAAGFFSGTIDLDPTAGTDPFTSVANNGTSDVFLVKLSSAGNYVYGRAFGGSTNDLPNRLAVDASQNVYITGNFSGTADFDPSAGISTLSSVGPSDIFVTKLNSAGNFLWANQGGSTIGEQAGGIDVDLSGNVYISGSFAGVGAIFGGFNVNSVNGLTQDIYIAKLNSSGVYQWVRTMGGFFDDYSSDLDVDRDGSVYTTGYFTTSADMNPGPVALILTGTGTRTAYINKLDTNGNHVFAGRINAIGQSAGNRLFVDPNQNVYVTGSFAGQIAFFNGSGNVLYNSVAGSNDIFVGKLNRAGTFFTYSGTVGGFGSDVPGGLVVDRFGSIVFSGEVIGPADLHPAGTIPLTFVGAGASDFFFDKLTQPNTPTITGTLANQLVYDNKTIAPLRTAVINNPFGDTLNITVRIVNGVNRGDFTTASATGWTRNVVGNDIVYTRTFVAWNAQVAAQAAVRALVFEPRENAITPATTEKTIYTLTVDNTIVAPVTNTGEFSTNTYSVNNTAVIGGTIANQNVLETATISPFSTVTVNDPDTQTVTARVTIWNGINRGDFTPASSTGWTRVVSGANIIYSRIVTGPNVGSLVQPLVQSFVFQPLLHRSAPPTKVKTVFTVSVVGLSTGSNTSEISVLSQAVNTAPTLSGTLAGQTVPIAGTIKPFLPANITDPDFQPLKVTVRIVNGVNRGIFTTASASGWVRTTSGTDYVYTRTFNGINVGSLAQTNVRNLTYDPRVGAIAGESATFTITIDDLIAPAVTNSTTTVMTV